MEATPDQLNVLHSEPTLLLVRVYSPVLPCLALVGQGPTSMAPAPVLQAWWRSVEELISLHRRAGEFVAMLLDSNARVGSQDSPYIGSAHPEEENGPGSGSMCASRPWTCAPQRRLSSRALSEPGLGSPLTGRGSAWTISVSLATSCPRLGSPRLCRTPCWRWKPRLTTAQWSRGLLADRTGRTCSLAAAALVLSGRAPVARCTATHCRAVGKGSELPSRGRDLVCRPSRGAVR